MTNANETARRRQNAEVRRIDLYARLVKPSWAKAACLKCGTNLPASAAPCGTCEALTEAAV